MDEELAQRFYEKILNKESNPAVVLTQMYSTYYGFEFNSDLISFFGRLVKLYGRNIVFMALLELFDVETADHSNIRRFISYLSRRKFESKFLVAEVEDLSGELERFTKEIRKVKRQKLEERNPFDDSKS